MEKRSEKKRMIEVEPRKFPGSGARRKPLAKAKGSSEERRNGGLEDYQIVADYLTRHRPEAWRIDLALATVMGMITDRFMDIDVDMAMRIRSKMVPKFSLIGLKNTTNSVQTIPRIDAKIN